MTQTLTDKEKTEKVKEYAAHTIGSEHIYTGLTALEYTDGMKFVAETCGAYWLLIMVDSLQPEVLKVLQEKKLRNFQVWVLKNKLLTSEGAVEWVLEAWSDLPGDSELLTRQTFEFSDFPMELLPFEFWVEYGTAMLKQER